MKKKYIMLLVLPAAFLIVLSGCASGLPDGFVYVADVVKTAQLDIRYYVLVCPRLFRHTNKLVFSGFRMIAITPVMPTLVPHLFHDSLYIEPLTTCCTALRPSH